MNTVGELIRFKGHGVCSISWRASMADAARAFRENGVSSLLVYAGPRLAGIVTKNDLVRRLAEPGCSCDSIVGEGMTTELFTTLPDADLEQVLDRMVSGGFRHVPVVEDDQVVGMVTPIDVLMYQNNLLHSENEHLLQYLYGTY